MMKTKILQLISVALSDISDDTMDQIQVATMGSSDDLKVGEQVVAIGNALVWTVCHNRYCKCQKP